MLYKVYQKITGQKMKNDMPIEYTELYTNNVTVGARMLYTSGLDIKNKVPTYKYTPDGWKEIEPWQEDVDVIETDFIT